jgi:hypothetical protein
LDDVEVHTFEEICTQPATKVDPQDSSQVGRVVQEMIRFRDEYEVARCKNDHDLSAFWLRKTKKPVLSVLMVQKDGEEPKFYRGTNMEVRPVIQNAPWSTLIHIFARVECTGFDANRFTVC